jgi:hypothetical protein
MKISIQIWPAIKKVWPPLEYIKGKKEFVYVELQLFLQDGHQVRGFLLHPKQTDDPKTFGQQKDSRQKKVQFFILFLFSSCHYWPSYFVPSYPQQQ